MIEVTNIDTGDSVYYAGKRAKLMLELYRGHPGLKIRHIDGRGHPKPLHRRICTDCGTVLEVKPSPTGEAVTSHGLCGTCLCERVAEKDRAEREAEAVQRFWIDAEWYLGGEST